MSALLTSLKGLGRDLVDKRLWPVAVLLLAALVAVPVLIGRTGSAAAPAGIVAAAEPGAAGATPPAGAATAAAETAKTAKTRNAPAKAQAGGKFDDPFFDPQSRSAGKDTSAGGGGAGGGASATRAVSKSPTGEAAPRGETKPESTAPAAAKTPKPAATTPAPTVTPTPAAAAPAPSYLRTVVRVNGSSGGKARALARLTPVGGTTYPAAVFLGVAKAGARYAVFLLGPRATSHGQATCKGDTDCRIVGLKAGQTQVVTVRLPTGATRRFSIHVGSIRKVGTSAARARAARAYVHPDGRRVLRVMRRHAGTGAALRTARYDERAGLLRAATAVVKSASE